MTPAACVSLQPDSSVYFINLNATHAHYSCRGGYRYLYGDHHRLCDSNGTWTGQALQCTVDSIMPKTYLVILIVGATIAIFVACIPYDFYRFRKRKKKVRDHQERLSLVTRIAPSHATVILDNDTNSSKTAPEPPRKFGFKSLFSVFKFVGAKMKTAGEEESKSNSKSDNGKAKPLSEEGSSNSSSGGDGVCGSGSGGSAGAGCSGGSGSAIERSFSSGNSRNTDAGAGGPTTSSYVLDTHHSSGCPRSRDDVIDLCGPSSYGCRGNLVTQSSETSDDFDRQIFQKNDDNALSATSSSCSFSSQTGNGSADRSATPPKNVTSVTTSSSSSSSRASINSSAFRKAVKRSNLSLVSRRSNKMTKSASDTKITQELMSRSKEKISNSNPATVEVTPISSTVTTPTSINSFKINEEPNDFPVYIPPPPPPSSSSSIMKSSSKMASSSSPNLCRERREDRSIRSFQSQQTGNAGGENSYHSMPSIADAP